MRILCCDSNESRYQSVVKNMRGHIVDWATHPSDAIELMQCYTYDSILTDGDFNDVKKGKGRGREITDFVANCSYMHMNTFFVIYSMDQKETERMFVALQRQKIRSVIVPFAWLDLCAEHLLKAINQKTIGHYI